MRFARQFAALVAMDLSAVAQRLGPVLTIIIGVTCAVGVLVSMLAMGAGAWRQEMGDVRADRLIVTSLGARGLQSSIPREEAAAIRALPGILGGDDGEPIVVLASLVPIEGRRRVTGTRIFFPLAGTSNNLMQYLPELHVTDGRMFRRGAPIGRRFGRSRHAFVVRGAHAVRDHPTESHPFSRPD